MPGIRSQKQRILITGGSGLLGHTLCERLSARYEVIGVSLAHPIGIAAVQELRADLADSQTAASIVRDHRPDVVIHTAGLTQVDRCETEEKRAYSMNVALAEDVARAAAQAGAQLVHISTDHLFDGVSSFSTEATPVRPMNVYAKTKALAETRVSEAHPGALIVRTNFYGPGRPWRMSFTDWVIDNLKRGAETPLFEDVYISPIATAHLCGALEELMERKAMGIFHVAGSERISKYDLGMRVAQKFHLSTAAVRRMSIGSAHLKAPRPKDMSLSVEKVESFLGHALPGIEEGLETLLGERE